MHHEAVLRKKDEFDKVFKSYSCKTHTKGLYIMGCRNSLGFSRLGSIIPKKILKKAVMRNALRRRIRHGFRQHIMIEYTSCQNKENKQQIKEICGWDCVVVATPLLKYLKRENMSETVNRLLLSFFLEISKAPVSK